MTNVLKKIFATLFTFLFIPSLYADEGMWIPLLLEKYNIEDMQNQGLKLSAEDIYSINNASLKDAVVIFGGGCTGEVVSDQGLLFTNHHCGYRYVQSHSSVQNDYLTDGFWAMSKEQELPNPGLTVTFLERIEDVTKEVLEGTEFELTESSRQDIINKNIEALIGPLSGDKHHRAVIKPFYYGNEYYMFVYKIFSDVRLVGAPPSGIGNYGKDYDNWMWPRHTGDFSVFRIYADENNEPTDYSPDNKPYQPKKHLEVSLNGYEEGDFTMVMGYPGTTTQFYITDAVDMIVGKSYPKKIALRDKRLAIMEDYMNTSDKIRIQYSSKFRSVSNAWKKWKGIIMGLRKAGAMEKKKQLEEDFIRWSNSSPERKDLYGDILPGLKELYDELSDYYLVYEYSREAFLAIEMMDFIMDLSGFLVEAAPLSGEEKTKVLEQYKEKVDEFFKDFHMPVDRDIFSAMLEAFYQDIDSEFHPDIYNEIVKKYKADFNRYAKIVYKKSKIVNKQDFMQLLDEYGTNSEKFIKNLRKDPLYEIFVSFSRLYGEKVNARYAFLQEEIDRAYRDYVKGLREMNPNEIFYPDANFTMRVAYGEVEGYTPKDAVLYHYETTLSGVIEKYNTGLADYSIPDKLFQLYETKEYGRYADESGRMNVCFIASNHTSGGNSGSPVLNAKGQLIGLNFDRNWEGTMSDIFYDKSQCRNITVDIRYVLFLIDKYAGAGYLLDEMSIAEN